MASALTSHQDLLVITNNLNVAMLLYTYPRIEVIVAGGTVRRADGAVIGSAAINLIGQFKVDYAVIGASAIDEDGALLDFDYREVQASQAIIDNARSVMLVADATKLRRTAPVRIAHLSQIQTFVTDEALPPSLQTHLRRARHSGDRGGAEDAARGSRRERRLDRLHRCVQLKIGFSPVSSDDDDCLHALLAFVL